MSRLLSRHLLASLSLLAGITAEGCSSPDHSPAAAATPAAQPPSPAPAIPAAPRSAPPVAAAAATTPTGGLQAGQLYQLVAPVALFPDKLLAMVLAGSTHPDQIAAEAAMLQQNPGLSPRELQAALTPQPWDPAVKGLASFPRVLAQMARSPQWTAALGQAYARDPTDLMNAVQTLRQRALSQGHLKSGPQQTVVTRTVTTQTATVGEVVPAPQAYVEIEPAQPEVVYVPDYDPASVYGEDYGLWPGYAMDAGSYGYGYDYGPGWTEGMIGFGTGIAVGALLSHPWGWSHWGMHWGGPPPPGQGWGDWRAPAVYYDQRHYNVQHIHDIRPAAGPGGFGAGGMGGAAQGPGMTGGHWPRPQFDPHLNAHAWSSNGIGAGASWAHAGPDGNRIQMTPPALHSHPVSYIHQASAGPGLRSAGMPAFGSGRNVMMRQASWNAPQTGRGFEAARQAGGFQHSQESFHPAMHAAGPSFRPMPSFHPAPPPRAAPAPHEGGGGHHR